jgi:rhamnose transport system permease protein
VRTALERRHHENTATVTDPRRSFDIVLRVREFGIIAVLVVFVAVTYGIQHRFLSGQNITFILFDTTIFAFLALGEAMVVIARCVDLSVGSVLGLSAYLCGRLFSVVHGIPIPVVFLVGLLIGLGCGVVNGLIVAVGRVPSLVVTLASLYIIRGIDGLVVGGGVVVASSMPSSFITMGKATIFHVPYVTIVVAILIALGAYYLRSYRSGRELYAIGSNPEAARLVGIRTGWRVFNAFAVSGAIAGVCGVLWASYFGTVDSTAGTGYELQVIAAVVVGGVAIFGGSGTVIGAALGALLLETINTALYVLGISSFWDSAIAGVLLLVAISLDHTITLHVTAARRKRGNRLVT